MINLAAGKCVLSLQGERALTLREIEDLHFNVPQWLVNKDEQGNTLVRVFKFSTFTEACTFVNQVAAIAEEEQHYPYIIWANKNVTMQWQSKAVKGLHRNDFIMAAKVDEISG